MRCFNCHEPSTPDLTLPRFCVRCGHPMAQPSPYLDGGAETYLALTDENNRPPSVCSHSGGLLKACRQCGRLYDLTADQCQTANCTGPIVESVPAFPTPDGPMDGTRAVHWPGRFGSRLEVKSVVGTERLNLLAFRYGLLVGVAPDAVLLYQQDGDGWRRRERIRIENASPIRSLLLEDGCAYITSEKKTLRILLSGVTEASIEESITESCWLQTHCKGSWVRLVERTGDRCALLVRGQVGEREQTIELPFAAPQVAAMVADKQIVLATAKAGLILVDPQTERIETLATPPCRWVRIAITAETIVALGYRDTGKPVLIALSTRNEVLGQRDLDENFNADFTWQNEFLYLATESALARFRLSQISRQPDRVDLSRGEETQSRLLILRDIDGKVRVLMRRKQEAIHRLYLVDPESGDSIAVGGMQSSSPLFCPADSRIVLGIYEGDGLKLRTLTFPEAT